jgi:hypothetical protein
MVRMLECSIGDMASGGATPPEGGVTQEEVVKQFSYLMTEKVKKDLIDRKQSQSAMGAAAARSGGGTSFKASSLIDFICAVTLTNTNSLQSSCNSLKNYIAKIAQMAK